MSCSWPVCPPPVSSKDLPIIAPLAYVPKSGPHSRGPHRISPVRPIRRTLRHSKKLRNPRAAFRHVREQLQFRLPDSNVRPQRQQTADRRRDGGIARGLVWSADEIVDGVISTRRFRVSTLDPLILDLLEWLGPQRRHVCRGHGRMANVLPAASGVGRSQRTRIHRPTKRTKPRNICVRLRTRCHASSDMPARSSTILGRIANRPTRFHCRPPDEQSPWPPCRHLTLQPPWPTLVSGLARDRSLRGSPLRLHQCTKLFSRPRGRTSSRI